MPFHKLLWEVPGLRRIESSVYFILAPDVLKVKIGTAKDVNKRLIGLACGSPVPLVLLGTIHGASSVERWCHFHCFGDRSHLEWFNWTPRVAAFVDNVLRHGEFAAQALCAKEFRNDARRGYGGSYAPLPPATSEQRYARDSKFGPLGICQCGICVPDEDA